MSVVIDDNKLFCKKLWTFCSEFLSWVVDFRLHFVPFWPFGCQIECSPIWSLRLFRNHGRVSVHTVKMYM